MPELTALTVHLHAAWPERLISESGIHEGGFGLHPSDGVNSPPGSRPGCPAS